MPIERFGIDDENGRPVWLYLLGKTTEGLYRMVKNNGTEILLMTEAEITKLRDQKPKHVRLPYRIFECPFCLHRKKWTAEAQAKTVFDTPMIVCSICGTEMDILPVPASLEELENTPIDKE